MRHTIPYSVELLHGWQAICELDEEENWTERTQVVTKEDHKLYSETARVRSRPGRSRGVGWGGQADLPTNFWTKAEACRAKFVI